MAPERWEPIYAISNEKSFSVRTLYNMGGAFSGILAMGRDRDRDCEGDP